MKRLHITQDEHGFWFMSLEEEDGSMKVLAHHFVTPDHLIAEAEEMARDAATVPGDANAPGLLNAPKKIDGGLEILVDTPRRQLAPNPTEWPVRYQPPEPKKVGE